MVRRLLADDFIEHEETPGLAPTKDGVVVLPMHIAAFPDLRIDGEDVLASGDKVVARAPHRDPRGEFMGMPATGKSVDVQLIDIIRFGDDGLAREHWGVFDAMTMMQQLGVVPADGPGSRPPRPSAAAQRVQPGHVLGAQPKSSGAAFSTIRSRVRDFGIAGIPRWTHQRTSTWAGVRPGALAIAATPGRAAGGRGPGGCRTRARPRGPGGRSAPPGRRPAGATRSG